MKKHLPALLLASLLINPGFSSVFAQAAKVPQAAASGPSAEEPSKPITAVEKRLFQTNHLGNLPKTAAVEYSFKRSGSLGENFQDSVVLNVATTAAGQTAKVQFLSGARGVSLPEIVNAEANPVILNFLERDISEMEKMTKGKKNFFRNRIRLALSNTETLTPAIARVDGREIKADQIKVQPYLEDVVVKERAEKYVTKTYIFILSNQVPGGIYQIRTTVDDAARAGEALVDESLTFVKLRK